MTLVESQSQVPPATYTRKSPSPTHLSTQPHLRAVYGHQRRDSDTLRSMATPLVTSSSPTAVDNPLRNSPPSSSYSTANGRHRRNPTAPEPPTTSGVIAPPGLSINTAGKTWAAGESRDSDAGTPLDEGFHGPTSAPPKNAHMLPPPIPVKQVQSAPQPNPPAPDVRARNMIVRLQNCCRHAATLNLTRVTRLTKKRTLASI